MSKKTNQLKQQAKSKPKAKGSRPPKRKGNTVNPFPPPPADFFYNTISDLVFMMMLKQTGIREAFAEHLAKMATQKDAAIQSRVIDQQAQHGAQGEETKMQFDLNKARWGKE